MGRHAAPEGASADPIVAGALARRPSEATQHAAEEGPLGWPGTPAPGGGGLGWPADATGTDAPAGEAEEEPAPPVRRSWRRLLGAGRVA